MGFTERGWTPSPEAALAVFIEVVTASLCVLALATENSIARTEGIG